MSVGGDRRIVVVVGRRPTPLPVETSGVLSDKRLVMLVIGWPLTEDQQRAVDEARGVARTANVVFDAILVPSSRSVATQVLPGDDVFVAAHRSEGRKIRRALAAAGLSVPARQ